MGKHTVEFKTARLPDGYAEWQFQEAFELLCEKFGGRERGREEAKRLIEEMEQ